MKLKFKVQPYQTSAVESVVDCCAGQPLVSGIAYRIDPGRRAQTSAFDEGFKNADLQLTELQVLANIKEVQRRQSLPMSDALRTNAGCRFNLDVEMETGTGKTYCYIKAIFEMNKHYGWSKFIVIGHEVAHLAVAHQALDQGNVDAPTRPALAAADRAYIPVSN